MGETNGLQRKKEQVLGGKLGLSSTSVIILLAFVAIIGAVLMLKTAVGSGSGSTEGGARAQVSDPLDYSARRYDMTSVKVVETDDSLIVPLADIKKYRMVSFNTRLRADVPSGSYAGSDIPLLAYITPAGYLATVVSYCEPCRSTESHTETDGTLTCNVCGTKWSLEDEAPVSGACAEYPPAPVKSEVRGDKVYIDKQEIGSWKPRVES